MAEREEKVDPIDPKEFLAQIKQVYAYFNEVLKNGDAGERFAAIIRMNMMNKALEDLAYVYRQKSKVPGDKLLAAIEASQKELPAMEEFKKNMRDMEKTVEETKKLMGKHNPIQNTKNKRGLKLRRLGRNRVK